MSRMHASLKTAPRHLHHAARWLGRGFLLGMLGLMSLGARATGGDEGGQGGGKMSAGCAKKGVMSESAAAPAPPAAPSEKRWLPAGGEALAVVDLQAESGSSSDATVITSLLRGELVKTGKFKIVEKRQMEKVLAEQAFQQTGCTSQECAVKLGRLLNVQLMIVGEFGKLMGDSFATVRVVNVESGEIVYADKAKGNTSDQLEAALRSVARRVAGLETGGGTPAAAPAPAAPAAPGPVRRRQ